MLHNQSYALSCLIIFLAFSSFAEKAVIFLGPPGAGKGTQTVLLKAATNRPLISPTNMLREERIKLSDLGKARNTYPSIRDMLKCSIAIKRLSELRHEGILPGIVIFDNWPKKPNALQLAKEAILGDAIPLVIELVVDQGVLLKRALQRKICPNSLCGKSYGLGETPSDDNKCTACKTELFQRFNDNETCFPRRIKSYFLLRQQIHKEYNKSAIPIHEIDGDRDPQEVHKDILKLYDNYISQSQ